MDRQPNNNLWAEKLLQVSKPDSGEAWTGMEALLDRKMPQRSRGDRRRWLLVILLLLLLIGVCNCPGRGRLFHGSGTTRAVVPAAPALAPVATRRAPATTPEAIATPTRRGVQPGPLPPAAAATAKIPAKPATEANPALPGAGVSHPVVIAAVHTTQKNKRTIAHRTHPRIRVHTPGRPADFDGITQTGTYSTLSGTTPTRPQPAAKRGAARKDSAITKDIPATKDTKDSTHKKPPAPVQEREQKEKDHGWVIGAGLNQFFPTGGQRGSTYNSNGLTGTLTDYLPVPMIRYYLNRKTYLQLEVQFNTPQPTAKNLVISAPAPDTSSTGGVFTQVTSSASIQQLYYFNVPLSIHYNPWDNLNIGAGVQWSHLSNAIGEFDSSTSTSINGNPPNIVDAKATKSFKGDTLYRRIKTNELRILVDVNYAYKHFVLGVRYNQALSNFVNLQLPTGGTTQARNSSLQLYLRYILWDTRKKKTPPSPPK